MRSGCCTRERPHARAERVERSGTTTPSKQAGVILQHGADRGRELFDDTTKGCHPHGLDLGDDRRDKSGDLIAFLDG